MVCQELNWVLRPIFEQKGDSLFKVVPNLLFLKVVLGLHLVVGVGLRVVVGIWLCAIESTSHTMGQFFVR